MALETFSTLELESGWQEVFAPVFQQNEWISLWNLLEQKQADGVEILPKPEHWFRAFKYTPFHQASVVILGQDPYPTPGHAHGLSFSVGESVSPLPRSLKNIFRELNDDLNIDNQKGDLTVWAQRGVLMLNAVLTVEAGHAGSHRGIGWELLTEQVIRRLNAQARPLVFILWGADARKRGRDLDRERHLVIESAHPSPLSAYRGFFGSKPFSRANQFLTSQGITAIDWSL